jgi:hypothetical protein
VDELKTKRRSFQFSLRKLMLWTAVWSIYLGVVEWVELPLRDTVILTVYVVVLLAIRIQRGLDPGYKIAFVSGGGLPRLSCALKHVLG